MVFAGCWDKSVWSWNASTRQPVTRYIGHGDFVKAVLPISIQGTELLVSASADAGIIVWDVATGKKVHTLKGHTRGVLALALDPEESNPSKDTVTIFSAGSDRELRRWSISIDRATEMLPSPIIVHETSIDAIHFDTDGDLWSASADKTAKCLVRGRDWEEDSRFEHPDFVRDVAIDEEGGWVLTACRDEDVRVWDKSSGKLHHTFSGHYEEVTALYMLTGHRLVSASIDGTIRLWSLKIQDLAKAVQEAEDEKAGKVKEPDVEEKEDLMTAEEEAELAELMGDSD